jgi:hypothetical protein
VMKQPAEAWALKTIGFTWKRRGGACDSLREMKGSGPDNAWIPYGGGGLGARSVAAAACVHDSGGSWRLGVTEGKVGLGRLGRRSARWPRPSWVLKSCGPALLPKKNEFRSGL